MLQFHTLTDEEVRQLSDTLFNARTTGKALPEFPGKLPATLEQAYAVQDLLLQLLTITLWAGKSAWLFQSFVSK